MKKPILVVAVAGLSVLAVAQADKKTDAKQSDSTVSAREASSGMATGKTATYDVKKAEGAKQAAPQSSGKVTPDKMEAGSESLKKVDVSSTKPTNKSAQDDWQAKQAATGNANGDGKTQVSAPRDAATGMASGKRQHQPLLVNKDEDQQQPEQPKK